MLILLRCLLLNGMLWCVSAHRMHAAQDLVMTSLAAGAAILRYTRHQLLLLRPSYPGN